MEPSKKANELYFQFEKLFIDSNADSWGQEAKKCALIMVDEILSLKTQGGSWDNWEHNPHHYYSTGYWMQVKAEIKKL